MRSSTWRALGNTYVARRAGRAEAPCDADALRLATLAAGTDGVLEVVEVARRRGGDRDLEPGRLQRRALGKRHAHRGARGSRARSGRRVSPRIRLAARSVSPRRRSEVEQDLGDVMVGRPEASRSTASVSFDAGLGREPARRRDREPPATTPPARPAPRDARAVSRSARTSRSPASTARGGDGARLGARRGGDARSGTSAVAAAAAAGDARLVRRARCACTSPAETLARRRRARAARRSTARRPRSSAARPSTACASSTSRPSGSRRYAERPHG